MKKLAAALTCCAIGCASASQSPTSCDLRQRVGTYRVTLVEESGDCGPVPSSLISLNPMNTSNGLGVGCKIESERASEGDCKLERAVTCPDSDGTYVTRDTVGDGSRLEGTVTITLKTHTPCLSTYGVTFVRQ